MSANEQFGKWQGRWGMVSVVCVCALGNAQIAAAQQSSSKPVEEVIVTAQKRAERLQDVPISISVLDGGNLDSSAFSGVTEALRTVPGVVATISGQNGGTQLSVRGVTAGGAKFAGSSTVGYYLDAVPFGLVRSAVLPDANPYDLDRIEVLRGPQGTLYGANAQIGVVRILTKDPSLDKFELKTRGSMSSTRKGGDSGRIDAAVNVPLISDKLAARAVIGYEDQSGWIDRPGEKDANDAQIKTARLKLKGQLSEQFSVVAAAWLSRSDYGAPSWSADAERSPFDHEPMWTDYDVFSLKADYAFTGFSLTSSSSYMDYKARGFTDFSPGSLTGLQLETIDDADVFTQEVNLASSLDGPWRWTLGGIYRDGDTRLFQYFGPLITPVPLDFTYTSESFAVFGELTRTFLDDRLELTGGLRYFRDEVEQQENLNFDGVGLLQNRTSEFKKISPRVVLTWHQSDSLTTYASYAEGFRSGFDQSITVQVAAPGFPPAEEDNLKNYEVGAKGVAWDNRLTFDAAIFYLEWKDIQQSLAVPYRGSAVTALINSKTASGLGFEFSTTAAFSDALSMGVTFSWNDLSFDSDVFTISTGVPVLFFPKGARPNLSPEYTAGISGDYAFPFGSGGYEGRFSLSGNYSSEVDSRSVLGTALTVTTSEPLLFGRASFSIDSPSHWTATAYVENISNEDDAFAASSAPNNDVRPRPRTFGLQFEYRL